MATPSGRSMCKIRIVPACAARTSGKTTISLRRFIQIAAAQHNSAIVIHFIISSCLNESLLTNSFIANFDESSLRRGARHDPPRAVNCGEQRFSRNRRINSFDNHRVVAHASADETFLSRKSRRCAFAHDPIFPAIMFFPPGKVMMVMHFFDNVRAQNIPRTTCRATASRPAYA